MQAVSQDYKKVMRQKYRNQASYIRVTIGVINQEAQASAYIPNTENYAYYSSFKQPLNNDAVAELYATCDQNYTVADGSMYFLPRNRQDCVLNQGIVSEALLGPIEVHFSGPFDIKGLTIEFGQAYPVDFTIETNNNTVEVTGNTSGHFVTDDVFEGVMYLRFTPKVMSNGQGRFRIHQITMGIGIYFDNRKIISATKKEHISPIMEELQTIDFDLVVENTDRTYDIENEESTVNFLETGQQIEVLYGQELEDTTVEWLPGAVLLLRSWSVDDEQMSFSASDRFEDMNGIYYGGLYRSEGISLYDLAEDVMEDAGADLQTYWFDPYLKEIIVQNPMPAISYKEALQLISNAGRCVLYQDRTGKIVIKSSFIPDMIASSDNEAYFSNAGAVLDAEPKITYATAEKEHTNAAKVQYFLPRESDEAVYLNTGYISKAVAGADGLFTENPSLEILLEASYTCFGITLEFGGNPPEKMVFRVYLSEELREEYQVSELSSVMIVNHEFPEFDKLVLEFTEGQPYNRVSLNQINFGNSTDYELSYGCELTKYPKGAQTKKTKELQIVRTLYNASSEEKELVREVITLSAADNQYTFYFSNPSYGLSCSLADLAEGQNVKIVASSCYFITVEVEGVAGSCEIVITGKEYVVTKSTVSRQLGREGTVETWENPLVSTLEHGIDMADWIGDYLRADHEYDLQYRGEPRIDANDLVYLENKYVPDLLLRVYEHTLNFNGSLSGTIKARREMSNVAGT